MEVLDLLLVGVHREDLLLSVLVISLYNKFQSD